ncbi:MAG: ornithine carbamoyltransferase [Actinobacteria bacterium]|nr:ornithine carbamoyltransferase [Actinomycetota bacterium]
MSLLDIVDLSPDDLAAVLELAAAPIASLGRPLDGLGVALIFEKPSNRTRHSMEMAVVQLGGHPVYTRGEEVGFDVRESVEDVARIMSGYHAILAARVFSHEVVARLSDAASVPVVNMLSDHSHPLQGLADVLTMREVLGPLDGHTVAYVGDYNNVARSLAEASIMLGMHVRLGCPVGFEASDAELARLDALGSGTVHQTADPAAAVEGAEVVHTDTWTSMGQEAEQAARAEVFSRYQVNAGLMGHAAGDAWFMHCLPAYRGLEVSADVIDGPRSLVVRQGHNRMHSARGALAFLLGGRP